MLPFPPVYRREQEIHGSDTKGDIPMSMRICDKESAQIITLDRNPLWSPELFLLIFPYNVFLV
jgi:hypothetical protein